MFTGAPATGKTTIYKELVAKGYTPIPTHMTRHPRAGEVHGLDAFFLSIDNFRRNFDSGHYIEKTLDFTCYQGNHYGSPREYFRTNLPGQKSRVFVCVSTEITGEVKRVLGTNGLWVHLTAGENQRLERLISRGMGETSARQRITNIGGDSHIIPPDCDLLIDTSYISTDNTIKLIMDHLALR